MKTCFRILAVVGLLASAGIAQADEITQTLNFGPGTPNFNVPLTFDKYDGECDLISIQIIFELSISGGQLSVDNDGAGPAVVNVELGATGTLSSVDVTLLNNLFQPVTGALAASTTDTFNLDPDDGDGPNNFDPSPPDGDTMLGGDVSDNGSGFINSLFFADYIGAGTFDINVAINQILDFGGVGGVEGSFSPVTASGSVTVIYTTECIPEPSTMVLAGLGAMGLGYVALRRRVR